MQIQIRFKLKARRSGQFSLLFCICLTILSAVTACSRERSAVPAPVKLDDGWETASLDDVGINEKLMREATDRIRDSTYPNVHSVLIVKDGRLVFEEYFDGYAFDYLGDQFRGEYTEFGINSLHNLASVTKSFTSALLGIAIEQGFIQDEREQVFAFFPEYAHLKTQSHSRITLEHLLTMTSGLEWNEMEVWLGDTRNDLIQLFIVSDPLEYILAKPLVTEPGTTWYYNGGGVNLLGEVIRRASGLRIDDFSEKVLFSPLGIKDYQWDHINPDIIHASGNLKLRLRDMAKFGYLFLNGGTWNGERIIPEEWIKTSTRAHVSIPWDSMREILGDEYVDLLKTEGDRYGYLWWLKTYEVNSHTIASFYADGWGGQNIIVFPSLDMVAVFTGGNYVGHEPVDDIVTQYVLPAVLR
jgi:CubicO group peptidase (beta-lactamase class C family)